MFFFVSYRGQATFCMCRSGPTKARTEHHLSKLRRIVTAAIVVVDHLKRKNDLLEHFNVNKQNHNTIYVTTGVQ